MFALPLSLFATLAALLPSEPPPTRVPFAAVPWAEHDPIRAIPATSYVGARFAGLDACRRVADRLELVRSIERLAAPGRKRLGERGLTELRPLDRMLGEIGLDRAMIRSVLRRPCAAGIGRLTFFDGEPVPSFAIAFDVKGHEQAVWDAVLRAAAGIVEHRELVLHTGEEDGVSFALLRHPRFDGRVVAGLADGALLLANSVDYARECLETWRGRADSIADTPVARRGVDRLGAEPLLALVVNPPSVGRLLPYEISAALRALGLDGVEGAFVGTRVDGQVSRELLHVATDRMPEGLVSSLMPRPSTTSRAFGYVDAPDALATLAGEVDGRACVASLRRFVAALPAEPRRELLREIGGPLRHFTQDAPQSARMLGELLARGRYAWSATVTAPGGTSSVIPAGILVLEPTEGDDDTASAEALCARLDSMLAEVGQTVESARFRGLDLRYFRLPTKARIAPAFGVHEGRFVLATDLRLLKQALVRRIEAVEAGKGPVEFRVATTPVAAFGRIHVHNLVRIYWPLVSRAAAMFRDHEEIAPWIDLDALPERDELAAMLEDTRIGATRHERGVDWVGESSLGTGALLAVLGSALDEFLGASRRARTH